jgi:hypothetical protein
MIPTFTTVLSAACATENGATGISNCVYCAYLSITAAYFDSRNNNTQEIIYAHTLFFTPDVFVLAAHDTNLHHGFIRRLRH